VAEAVAVVRTNQHNKRLRPEQPIKVMAEQQEFKTTEEAVVAEPALLPVF
jgi:hypothetical protein